jgi:bifunctional DNA-binding transcriptional regulator/antitoxin component of YhaV-PrlF toxin-antitoxin module
MALVKVSPALKVTISREIREKLKIVAGQELQMYVRDGSVRLSVPRSVEPLRGMAEGMSWKDDYRDRTDRF